MRKILCLFFTLLATSQIYPSEYRYYLSACAVFNDEADYLKEWIEYHLLMGVEHFYLYNNNSTDDYLEVLTPYMEGGIVELYDWPSPPDRDWTPWQKTAYNHCIKIAVKKTKWLAVIDLDEYILPLEAKSLPQFLKEYEEFGGVKIYWQNYGTCHLKTIPKGELMTESLILKYPTDSEVNLPGKTIFRPKAVKKAFVHNMLYRKKYFAVIENKQRYRNQPVKIDKIRINHYWTRAEDFFFQFKIPRIERSSGRKLRPEEIEGILRESNQVEDTTMFQYTEALRDRMR